MARETLPGSLDEWVLWLLSSEDVASGSPTEGGLREGLVISIYSRGCVVRADGEDLHCVLPVEMARNQRSELAVGDLVRFEEVGEDRWLRSVEPRRTRLSRPDPHSVEIERVIVANVDAVVIVVAATSPPLQPRLIDRYLIAVQRSGAEALICVNKFDLAQSVEERAAVDATLEPYDALGVPIHRVSAETGAGLLGLRESLRSRLCALVGISGVGKTSLTNALSAELDLKTREVRERDGKGRHTTSASTLYELEGGIRLIDTPGVRAFGLWKLSQAELQWYFPEFEPHLGGCRYRDCSHSHEDECGVKAAAAEGLLPAPRVQSYLRLLRSLDQER